MDVHIEWVPLPEVRRWESNPKAHAVDDIMASIEAVGFVDPLIVDERSGTLAAGHGRLETLTKMKAEGRPVPERVKVREDGEWLVPVLRGIRFNSDSEAAAYALADNRTVELGGVNEAAQVDLLKWLRQTGGEPALAGTGYASKDVDAMIKAQGGGPPGKPKDYDESVAAGLEVQSRWTVKFPRGAQPEVERAVAALAADIPGFKATFED